MVVITRLRVPIRVSFEITWSCQSTCIFCEPKLCTGPNISKNTEVQTSEAKQIIQNCASFGLRYMFLTGGEPLLRIDLEELIDYCITVGIAPCISTNGILLTRQRAKSLYAAGLKAIQVSIQGDSSATHDLITGTPGGFQKTLQGIKNASEEFPKIDVTTVCLRSNFRRIPLLYDMLLKMGVKGGFRVLRPMCFSEHMLTEVITLADYTWLKNSLSKLEQDRFNITSIACVPGTGNLSSLSGLIHPLAVTCYAAKTMLAILPDGTAVPCQGLRDFPLGNLLNNAFETIWNNDKAKQFSELTPDKYQGNCARCEDKWMCYSCRAIAHVLDGNLFGDDISCERLNPTRECSRV